MKMSKQRLKSIIMQEVKNIMENKRKKGSWREGDKSVSDPDAHDDGEQAGDEGAGAHSDDTDDSGHGMRAGDKSDKKGRKRPDFRPKNRKDSVKEDYDYTEEKHDDEDEDHLERIRDDINRHIDALRDQHRRVKDYEDRKDD